MNQPDSDETRGNPYRDLPPKNFWRAGVADRSPFDIDELWVPKFPIRREDKVVTAGSCFAQHIGRALTANGFAWHDAEPAPPGLSEESRRRFNYGVFSFRTGNIYTAAQLRQWVSWAAGKSKCPKETWRRGERFIDPFRPNIEPNGFVSERELEVSRGGTLNAIASAVRDASVFVFTMGLTESWEHRSGYSYPMCPGTVAGTFDAASHRFVNASYPEIIKDMTTAITMMRQINKDLRFLLTVSPVPLTATASDGHVLAATTYSKSTLRAVAGDLAARHDYVDYFPSYEIITGFPFRAMFYEANLRNVAPHGVDFVMRSFFRGLTGKYPDIGGGEASDPAHGQRDAPRGKARKTAAEDTDDDVVCEEELLAAFGDAEK